MVSTVLLLPSMLRTLPGWGGRGLVSRKLGPRLDEPENECEAHFVSCCSGSGFWSLPRKLCPSEHTSLSHSPGLPRRAGLSVAHHSYCAVASVPLG